MEGNMERFQAKMKDLLAYAAKKKNVSLTYSLVTNCPRFSDLKQQVWD